MSQECSRRTRPKITKEQKQRLIELIKSSPQLRYGVKNSKTTEKGKNAIRRWKEIASELNAMDDTVQKEWSVWKKTWTDIRSNLKKAAIKKGWNRINPDYDEDEYDEDRPDSVFDNILDKFVDNSKMYLDSGDDETNNTLELKTLEEEISLDSHQPPAKLSSGIMIIQHNNNTDAFPKAENNIEIREEEISDTNNFRGFNRCESYSMKVNNDPPVIKISTRPHHMNNIPNRKTKKKKSSFRDTMGIYLNRKSRVKEDYYTKKLRLLERDVIAKESIASSLRMLTEGRSDLF